MIDVDQAIGKVRDGNLDSYGDIVREFQARLRGYLAVQCPDAAQVDDLAQRTFVWAYEHLQDYEPGTRFFAWLTAIARNLLLAEFEVQKRAAAKQKRYLEYMEVAETAGEVSREDGTAAAGYSRALQECLDSLPPQSKSLVVDRYRDRKPVRMLSKESGRNETAIKVALFRVRQALRLCVEGKLKNAAWLSAEAEEPGYA